MGKRIIVVISLLMIFFMIITGCQSSASELSVEDVKSMTIEFVNLPNDQCFTFTPDKHLNEIKRFIETINLAERIEKEHIPQPVKITLLLSNDKEITVWGGKGGVQTVKEGRKQYTIKGQELDRYLTSLCNKLHNDGKDNLQLQTMAEIGTRLHELEEGRNKDKIVLRINGQEIRYKEFARYLIDKEIYNKNMGFGVRVEEVDVEDIIRRITKKVVIMVEAERLGLLPMRQDVLEYIDRIRQEIETADHVEDLHALIEKLDVSVDEYWYEYEFEGNEYLLASQNLFDYFKALDKEKNKDDVQYKEDMKYTGRANKRFEAYINQLIEEAEVEMIDENLVFKNE